MKPNPFVHIVAFVMGLAAVGCGDEPKKEDSKGSTSHLASGDEQTPRSAEQSDPYIEENKVTENGVREDVEDEWNRSYTPGGEGDGSGGGPEGRTGNNVDPSSDDDEGRDRAESGDDDNGEGTDPNTGE
jgi:hypothetical protein